MGDMWEICGPTRREEQQVMTPSQYSQVGPCTSVNGQHAHATCSPLLGEGVGASGGHS